MKVLRVFLRESMKAPFRMSWPGFLLWASVAGVCLFAMASILFVVPGILLSWQVRYLMDPAVERQTAVIFSVAPGSSYYSRDRGYIYTNPTTVWVKADDGRLRLLFYSELDVTWASGDKLDVFVPSAFDGQACELEEDCRFSSTQLGVAIGWLVLSTLLTVVVVRTVNGWRRQG